MSGDQKLLAVSWLDGDVRVELLLIVQYLCGAIPAASVRRSVVVVVVVVVVARTEVCLRVQITSESPICGERYQCAVPLPH
jgi:hypothetical protein